MIEKKTNIMSNSQIVNVIIMDSGTVTQSLSNGLVSLNRDVLMKLIRMACDAEKTRNIIGMTEVFYTWSKLKIFRWATSAVNISIAFLPNLKASAAVVVVGNTLRGGKAFTPFFFFLDTEMIYGIYKIVFKSESSYSHRWCGAAHKTSMQTLTKNEIADGSFQVGSNGIFCGEKRVLEKNLFPFVGKVAVGLELCLDGGAQGKSEREGRGKGGKVYVFAMGTQVPYVITEIPPNVHFFIHIRSYSGDFVGEVQSFQRLSAPTADKALQCTEYEWK